MATEKTRTIARLLAFIIVGLVLVGFGLDWASTSPSLCASCHEMEPRAHQWEQSAHSAVLCVECHQAPRPWYAMPQRLVDRAGLIVRDVSAHVSGDFDDPVEVRSPGVAPIADEVCLQCHDPNRKATSGYRITIDHVEHAKRNGSCVSCHVRTAHPIETRGRALSFMAQCFTCHGSPDQPEASDECGECHPSDYELVPASHAERAWSEDHGKTALEDRRLCEMCHVERFCTDCHGIEMPHPDGWAGGEDGHVSAAESNRASCTKCHGQRLDMCTMCHHTGYDPMQGTWVKQHYQEVRKRGASFCFASCHAPVFCIGCHAGGATPVPN